MQKKTYRLLAALAAVLLSASATAQNSYQFRGVLPDAAQWVDTYFAKGVVPPFSFLYDGVPSATFLKKWNFTSEDGIPSQDGEFVRIFTWSDPATQRTSERDVRHLHVTDLTTVLPASVGKAQHPFHCIVTRISLNLCSYFQLCGRVAPGKYPDELPILRGDSIF